MKLKVPGLLLAVLLIVLAVNVASFRQELLNVPRVRVGPLHADVPAGPRLRFAAVGDTGTGDDAQLQVAAAMEARCKAQGGYDGILLLGDNAYPAGFRSPDDPQWQRKVVEPYGGDCLGKAPIYAVLGNHDYKEDPAAQIEFSLLYPRWHMPNRFYSVSFGKLLKLVALDSNFSEVCFNAHFCVVDFLVDSLKTRDTTWTIVTAHHPLASSSDRGFGYRGGFRGALLEPFLCNRADAYLSGHSHHMEHMHPDDCRLDLFVSGGGGGDLAGIRDVRSDTKFVLPQWGFLDIDLTETEMTSRFVGVDGAVLYETKKKAAAW